MKKTLFICCLLFLLPVATVFSQLSEGGLPFSFNANNLRSSTVIPEFKLQTILPQQLRSASLLNGTPLKYSVAQDVAIDIKKMGIQSAVDLGTTWRLRIVSDSALSLQVFFQNLVFPQELPSFCIILIIRLFTVLLQKKTALKTALLPLSIFREIPL